MALKKITSIDTSNIVLKDIIVDDEDCPIVLEEMHEKAENQEVYYIDLQGNSRVINFAIERLPHCCGLKEIGDLDDIDFISQKAFNILMKGLLISNYTFIVNTNGEKTSQTWDEKLTKSKMFTLVKEFVNPSSKNPIKVWISNHLK